MMYGFNRGFDRGDMMDNFAQHPVISWIVAGICMLIIIAIVITVIIVLVKMSNRNSAAHMMHNTPPAPQKNDAALRMLDERYARSEIGDEEYKAKKANLMS